MMAIANVIGLSSGKRLVSSTCHYSDISERFGPCTNTNNPQNHVGSTKHIISAKNSTGFNSKKLVKSVIEYVDAAPSASTLEPWIIHGSSLLTDETSCLETDSVDVIILLQKLMLEKQWNTQNEARERIQVTCSGTSARNRRMDYRRKVVIRQKGGTSQINDSKEWKSAISQEVVQNRLKGYGKGVSSDQLLTHAEVVLLSDKIKVGLSLEDRKSRLKERLGSEPSDEQLACALRISRRNLQSKLMESSLAREKLAMRNVRLVMSIAQRYDNKGAEMADLVQGGLIGLLRGIEKFDSSKGFKISTYVYWWIRQGVSKALVENSRTLRLPTHLHERLNLIRNAKIRLEKEGITPSLDRIAEHLNMSQKKVRNATEAVSRVFSLDREAFPSLNGLPGETLHCYIADICEENIPWHGVDEWALKVYIEKHMKSLSVKLLTIWMILIKNEGLTLRQNEEFVYISHIFTKDRFVQRERQVGLVALEKLKHAARRKRLEAMTLKH